MNPVKNNLVALGSAAVLSVYAAGYLRTKEAADRFAEDERPVPTREHLQGPGPELPGGLTTGSQLTTDSGNSAMIADRKSPVATTAIGTAAKENSTAALTKAATNKAATTTETTPTAVVAAARLLDSAPPPQVVVATPPPAPATSGLTGTGSAAADTATQNPRGQWKDGSYSGWGTSRHGDIQATVEIRDGHIVSAMISQCLTRYSCSWISHLPGQVVSRQSANVDYVSGATQSTNAFYYAIVEALNKAK